MSRASKRLAPPRGVPKATWEPLTRFTQRVYLATCRIPKGQTRSYQWIANAIGRPRATRAVGNALQRNPFAPIIPCHLVIHSDGSLGGYARGPARKRALLRREHALI